MSTFLDIFRWSRSTGTERGPANTGPRPNTVNSTGDIIELADTELAAAAHRVYAHGAIAGWTVGDYEAAIDRTKVGSTTWDVLYEARRKLRQLPEVKS